MCTILFAHQIHPKYPFIMIANRDEFYKRPSKHAHFWKDAPAVFAGRDLEACGSWTGINRKGKLAFLTNYRDFSLIREDSLSRGALVAKFLLESPDPKSYLESVKDQRHKYNPFNLVVGSPGNLYYYGNVGAPIQRIEPGIYGLSNHLLDTPWPKVERARETFRTVVETYEEPPIEALWEILMDRTPVPDDQLPTDTHVPLETERLLSTIFIKGDKYGTRFQTLLLIDGDGNVRFHEREWVGDAYRERATHFATKPD